MNQVQREYNGLGQLFTKYQEHSSSVNTDTSLKVHYGYSELPRSGVSNLATRRALATGRAV